MVQPAQRSYSPAPASLTAGSDRVDQASELLRTVHVPIVTLNVVEAKRLKREYKEKLEEVYRLVKDEKQSLNDQRLCFVLAETFVLYGVLRCEESYPACMVMAREAVNEILGVPSLKRFSSLEELENNRNYSEEGFESLHDVFQGNARATVRSFLDRIAGDNPSAERERVDLLGRALMWYARGLMHTEGFKLEESKENFGRFDSVVDFCVTMLEQCDSYQEHRLLLAELYCTLSSSEVLLHIPNRQFLIRKAMNLLDEALGILYRRLQQEQVEDQDHLLFVNLLHSKASLLCSQRDYVAADAAVGEALNYAEELRGRRSGWTDLLVDQSYDHRDFGFYDLVKAKILLGLRDTEGARTHVLRALETFRYHEQDSRDAIRLAEGLLVEIKKRSSISARVRAAVFLIFRSIAVSVTHFISRTTALWNACFSWGRRVQPQTPGRSGMPRPQPQSL